MGQPLARHGSESYPSRAKNCIRHWYAGEPDVPGGTEYFYGDTGAKLGYEPLPVGSDFLSTQAGRLRDRSGDGVYFRQDRLALG